MLSDYLNTNTIKVMQTANTRDEAITIAGQILVDNSKTTPQYIQEMIDSVNELGPYMVISKGIALAHAKPAPSVLENAVSLVTLEKPVKFNNEQNDPVSVVIAFCATQTSGHLSVMKEIAKMLTRKDFLTFMENAKTSDEIVNYIENP